MLSASEQTTKLRSSLVTLRDEGVQREPGTCNLDARLDDGVSHRGYFLTYLGILSPLQTFQSYRSLRYPGIGTAMKPWYTKDGFRAGARPEERQERLSLEGELPVRTWPDLSPQHMAQSPNVPVSKKFAHVSMTHKH